MKYLNSFNLPPSFVEAVKKETYDISNNVKNRISVTTLIDSPRVKLLRERYWDRLEEDVTDNVWRLLGSSVHFVMDGISAENRLKEERLFVDVNGINITGKPDLYDGTTKTIQDYKLTSVWSVLLGDKPEWEKQLNCYAWLLRTYGFEVERIQIIAILRDWSKARAKREETYPKSAVAVIDIPLWSFEKQGEFVQERVNIHRAAENLPDEKLPECSSAEKWTTEDVYAVMKGSNKRAVKLFDKKEEAEEFAKTDKAYRVELRAGEDKRCEEYCNVKNFCPYYLAKLKQENAA